MRNWFACTALLSLLLVLGTGNARTDPGKYWKTVMKDQPMPDTIRARVVSSKSNVHLHASTENSDSHQKAEKSDVVLSGKGFDFDAEIKPSQLLVWRIHDKVDKSGLDLADKDFNFDAEIKPSQLLVWREHNPPNGLDLAGKDFNFDAEIKPSQLLVWREHGKVKAKENI